MALTAFETPISDVDGNLVGPWRSPRQMLAAQRYDAHASIHDDATAQKLGFRAATIEGPTHFSQFAPLCVRQWGRDWFETGCISAHYRNPVFEGEETRAILEKPAPGQTQSAILMIKRDGSEVLRGTASIGPEGPPSALASRISELRPLADPVITRDLRVGMTTAAQRVQMNADQTMGALYPFSLEDKLAVITEPSRFYREGAADNPWGRAIIPIEMLSVLFQYTSKDDKLPIRGPAVGLFADQEIRLLRGPLFVGASYELSRAVVALSGSRRTESVWLCTTVTAAGSTEPVARMLLNLASLKDSYARFAEEHTSLYG